jgi:glucosylceramidase
MKYLSLVLAPLMLLSCGRQPETKGTDTSTKQALTVAGKTVTVYTTADSTDLRITGNSSAVFGKLEPIAEGKIYVFVNPEKTYQSFLGIGGALTDASAETFARLPKNQQEEILTKYYDTDKGIGYTLARTNINSCDFSSDSYTYIAEGDKALKTFNIAHDLKFKIPLIKKAIEAAGGKLTLFASPWSPPAFMKDNGSMLHGGKLKSEFYDSWAKYYTKFIKKYADEDIPIWGITIQNEPMATQTWESCIYSSEDERDFLKRYLGPVMQQEGLKRVNIIVWDHNRDLMVQRAQTIFDDPDAARFAWGMGFHWYESWTGGDKMFSNVSIVNKTWPDKNLLFTEGCPESFNASRYYNWGLGEAYGRNMINDFNNGAVGWTDWNILLDETGGPNHVGNFCFAPVHADLKTGKIIYTNSYYYIGHFSKFIRPGAKRILSSPSRSMLLSTAFMNSDGKTAVVVMNNTEKKAKYNLVVGDQSAEIETLPHSIQTLVF